MQIDEMIVAIAKAGGISQENALRVYSEYNRLKVIKHDPSHGVSVIHGAFLDKETILRTLEMEGK